MSFLRTSLIQYCRLARAGFQTPRPVRLRTFQRRSSQMQMSSTIASRSSRVHRQCTASGIAMQDQICKNQAAREAVAATRNHNNWPKTCPAAPARLNDRRWNSSSNSIRSVRPLPLSLSRSTAKRLSCNAGYSSFAHHAIRPGTNPAFSWPIPQSLATFP